MGLGCTSDAVYCNLANLAAMRGDQLLALSWLERLAAVDPENENLKKVKDVYLPLDFLKRVKLHIN